MLPSSTVENYLKAIYLGVGALTAPNRLLPMGHLAAALGVAPGTATTMVKTLAESGLVEYEPYTGVALTEAGERLAALVVRRHRVVELFLVRVMGYRWDEVHDEAEQLEHVVSDRLIDRMDEMLGRPGQVNQLAMRLEDVELTDAVAADLDRRLPPGNVRPISWKIIDREIIGIQAFQNGILTVVLFIVFAIVALGILNTQLMSLFERVREFGVLMAIGARPRWIVRLILAESLVLGLVGVLLGVATGAAMIAYFGRHGLHLPVGQAFSYFLPFPSVIYLRPSWHQHAFACASVFLITLLASLPPALRAGRLKPAEALRHV